MKKLLILGMLFAMIGQKTVAQDKEKDAIKQLNLDWLNSYVKRDTTTLSHILAEDFILISPKGAKMRKQDVLANLVSPNQEYISVKVDSATVRLVDDQVGIITAYTTFIVKANGQQVTGKNCYSDVYVKRKGKWVVVSAHVTLLAMK